MKILKKIGQILLCPLPLLLMLAIQFTGVFLATIIIVITTQSPDPYSAVMEQYGILLLTVQCITLAVFALWYFLAYGHRKSFTLPHRVLSGRDLGLFLILGLSLYSLVLVYMGIASVVTPGEMEKYEAMIEESGMTDLTFLSTVSTLILAPLSEELIFRGITMNLSKKAVPSFWIANVIQAICFGIAHLNWIQGSYAFLLGLALGYVCEVYHSLYPGMLLHLVFNFFGTYLAVLLGLLPMPDLVQYLILAAVGSLLTVLCFSRLHRKKNPPKTPGYWTGEPMDF